MKRLLMAVCAVGMLGAAAPVAPTRVNAGQRLDELAREVRELRAETGTLPSSLEGIEGVTSGEELLLDPWGNPIYYLRVAGGFWLMSWGADGAPGGEGDAADVVHIAR